MPWLNTYEFNESRDVRLLLPPPLAVIDVCVGHPFLMNTNYVFPRPQPGAPRVRPPSRPPRVVKWAPSLPSSAPSNNLAGSRRDSNALRASIYDTALELGIGSNSLVTNWMFDGPLLEEPEAPVSLFVIFLTSFIFAVPQVQDIRFKLGGSNLGSMSKFRPSTFLLLYCFILFAHTHYPSC